MEFTVIDPAAKYKDPWTQVWAGSTNYGKSASPLMRAEDKRLVPRPVEQLWTPVAGAIHIHCRGSFLPVSPEMRDGWNQELHAKFQELWSAS